MRGGSSRGARGGRGGGGSINRFGKSGQGSVSTVDEAFRIDTQRQLIQFRDSLQDTLEFPSTLTSEQRAIIHSEGTKLGLVTKSTGSKKKEGDRQLTVYRTDQSARVGSSSPGMSLTGVISGDIEGEGLEGGRDSVDGLGSLRTPLLKLLPCTQSMLDTAARLAAAILPGGKKSGFGVPEMIEGLYNWESGARGLSPRPQTRQQRSLIECVAAMSRCPPQPKVAVTRDRQRASAEAHENWSEVQAVRRSLPAANRRSDFLAALGSSQVTIVSGDTGCGKSTQIPQYILENEPAANIIVTQPRRVAAMSLAERVAWEVCHPLGDLVGYNVRLESALSPATRLLYVTTGVLLRKLLSGGDDRRGGGGGSDRGGMEPPLRNVTHIVVDEVHERDIHTDFLLTCLRALLPLRPDLKVVIMSATLQLDLLTGYWGRAVEEAHAIWKIAGCYESIPQCASLSMSPSLVHVSGRAHAVTRFYLEDVLYQVRTGDYSVLSLPTQVEQGGASDAVHLVKSPLPLPPTSGSAREGGGSSGGSQRDSAGGSETFEVKGQALKAIIISSESSFPCTLCGRSDFKDVTSFAEHAGECYGSPPGPTGNTLMPFTSVPSALHKSPPISSSTAGEFFFACQVCRNATFSRVEEFAEHAGQCFGNFTPPSGQVVDAGSVVIEPPAQGEGGEAVAQDEGPPVSPLSPENMAALEERTRLLSQYPRNSGDAGDETDYDLLSKLLLKIVKGEVCVSHLQTGQPPTHTAFKSKRRAQVDAGGSTAPVGAVLVFLHGWDDIVALTNVLKEHAVLGNPSKVLLLPLHSQVPSSEQRRCFRPPPPGCVKIILATNIAETSLTIEDVVYVVDAGKVKEKRFDAYSGASSLAPVWCSKASARQRAGRAGRVRPGVCFHLFSRERHAAMDDFTQPEILRTSLEELCLQVQTLLDSGSVVVGTTTVANANERPESPSSEPLNPIVDFLSRSMSPPPKHSILVALSSLRSMGAMAHSPIHGRDTLTPLGVRLSALPVAPRLGKMLLWGILFRVLDPILTSVAAASCKSPFLLHATRKTKLRLAGGARSDVAGVLGAYNEFRAVRRKGGGSPFNGLECRWAAENGLSLGVLNTISAQRASLSAELATFLGLPPHSPLPHSLSFNSSSPSSTQNYSLVYALLATGLSPNFARCNPRQLLSQMSKLAAQSAARSGGRVDRSPPTIEVRGLSRLKKIKIHPSSLNSPSNGSSTNTSVIPAQNPTRAEWVAFEELYFSGTFGLCTLKNTTCVTSLPLLLLAGRCCGEGGSGKSGVEFPRNGNEGLRLGPSSFESWVEESLTPSSPSSYDTLMATLRDKSGCSRLGPPECRADDFVAVLSDSHEQAAQICLIRAALVLVFHRGVLLSKTAALAAESSPRDAELVDLVMKLIVAEESPRARA